jgi:hypothetical protein
MRKTGGRKNGFRFLKSPLILNDTTMRKTPRWLLQIILTAVMICIANGTATAFHDGGVAACDGCHSMHQSPDNPTTGAGNSKLTKGTDASSTCLNCHAGAGGPTSYSVMSTDGSAMTPGGDFFWLTKTFSWVGGTSPGNTHGHNIIAQDYGLTAETDPTSAPAVIYPSTDLGCTSCHDPHGKSKAGFPISGSGSYGAVPLPGASVGNYRLLGGAGYDGGNQTIGNTFAYDAPIARQNGALPYSESDTSHVDYGAGMSEWCANCHASLFNNNHQVGSSGFSHPAGSGALLGDCVANYNSYIKTGDLTGVSTTSYLALVPFERDETDPALLDPTSTEGPNSLSNVMCLTCHRAHASAFPYMGRWDFTAQLTIDSHPAAGDSGVTGNEVFYSYYGRDMATEFGVGQRILCEKCHDVPRNGYPPGW